MYFSSILYLAFASMVFGHSSRRLGQLFNEADFEGGSMFVYQDFSVDCVNLDAEFRDKVGSIKTFYLASCELFIKENCQGSKFYAGMEKAYGSIPGPPEVASVRCLGAVN